MVRDRARVYGYKINLPIHKLPQVVIGSVIPKDISRVKVRLL